MTERPWLAHYPEGVEPVLADITLPHVPALERQAAATYAATKAFTQVMPNGMNGSLTYRQVDEHSDAFAVYLRDVIGLQAGDRVAVQMPNCLAYPIVAFGIMKAGLVLVNTNPLYTPSEMRHQFSDSGAKALVIIDMFADRLPEVLPHTDIATVVTVRIAEFFPKPVAGVIRMVQKVWNRSLPKITAEQPETSVRELQNHVDDRGEHPLQRAHERALVRREPAEVPSRIGCGWHVTACLGCQALA